MTKYKSLLLVPGVLLGIMMSAKAADAPALNFKFSAIKVGKLTTMLGGINNSGVIVGQYQDKPAETRGFMLAGKTLTRIDHPKASETVCVHINSAGTIVGYYTGSDGVQQGFVYQNGKFKDVRGPAGALGSQANGINDDGLIVGAYSNSTGRSQGFLLKGNTYKTLHVPGAMASTATGINLKGNIVLNWLDKTGATQSSLYNGKTYKTINVPGALYSFAEDINTAGDVAYQWFETDFREHGALQQAGKYYTFDCAKSMSTAGSGLNDHHVIVGSCQPDNDFVRGFRAKY